YRARAVVYLAVAKLAAKAGEIDLASLAAGRAHHAAQATDDPGLTATAERQLACGLCAAGRFTDAEHAALDALTLARHHGTPGPALAAARAPRRRLAAMAPAGNGDPTGARRHLDAATGHATPLGTDGNHWWSAFGPTNVAVHTASAALALGDPAGAATA